MHVISEIVTFVKWTKRMNELFCKCISYLCPVNMLNCHAIHVLIYYSEIRVKNLYFGLKIIHYALLACITDEYYYYVFLCIAVYY